MTPSSGDSREATAVRQDPGIGTTKVTKRTKALVSLVSLVVKFS